MPWALVTGELIVCAWILVMLASDVLFHPAAQRWLWWIGLAGIVAAGTCVAHQPGGMHLIQQMWVADPFARYFKLLFLLTVAVILIMTRWEAHQLTSSLGAFYALLLTALLGMLTLASINDLLLLFIGLELLTFWL